MSLWKWPSKKKKKSGDIIVTGQRLMNKIRGKNIYNSVHQTPARGLNWQWEDQHNWQKIQCSTFWSSSFSFIDSQLLLLTESLTVTAPTQYVSPSRMTTIVSTLCSIHYNGFSYYWYADETQLFLPFPPDDSIVSAQIFVLRHLCFVERKASSTQSFQEMLVYLDKPSIKLSLQSLLETAKKKACFTYGRSKKAQHTYIIYLCAGFQWLSAMRLCLSW